MIPMWGIRLVYAAVAFALAGPLVPAFYTEDDFEHLKAALDGSEFRGRAAWTNYIPVTGLLWRVASWFGYDESAVVLRLLVPVLLVTCALLVHALVEHLSGRRGWAVASALAFLLHPALFEPVLRLSCMHYLLGLALTLAALLSGLRYLREGATRSLAAFGAAGLLALLSSLHSVSLMPVALLFCGALAATGGLPRPRRLAPLLFFTLALCAVAAGIMLKLGVLRHSIRPSSLGQSLVEHAWLIFHLLAWDVPFASSWYMKLCAFRILGAPIFPFALIAAPAALFAALAVLRGRETGGARALLCVAPAALLAAIFVPPKPYAMSRYIFFAGPWFCILLGYALDRIAAIPRRRIARIALAGALGAPLLLSSASWYCHQTARQKECAEITKGFVEATLSAPEATAVAVENMPVRLGDPLPWPRAPFFWIRQAFDAVSPPLAPGSGIRQVDVNWQGKPGWERFPDPSGGDRRAKVRLRWDGQRFETAQREESP
jgi:hypothetical protein